NKNAAKKPKVHQTTQKSPMNYVSNEQSTKIKRKPVRAPTSAAVTITLREGSTAIYGSIMKDAKAKIRVEELGIEYYPTKACHYRGNPNGDWRN
ncbi:unnamed protein product, partial [Iphiclides podalirius]